jgi:hypothetical protein
VDDPGAVRGREPGEHGAEDVECLLARQCLVFLQEVPQRDTGNVLHDDVGAVVLLPLVEHAHDVGVGQPGGRAGLLDEPAAEGLVVGQVAVHDLDRDTPFQPHVGGEVDGGHASARDARPHAVPLIDHPTDQRVRGRVRGHGRDSTNRSCRGSP